MGYELSVFSINFREKPLLENRIYQESTYLKPSNWAKWNFSTLGCVASLSSGVKDQANLSKSHA